MSKMEAQINTVSNRVAKWEGKVESTGVLELYKVILHVAFENEKFSAKKKGHTEEFYVYRPEWAELGERDAFLRRYKKEAKL